MARAPDTLSRLAAPAGAVIALTLAVGVWLIPGSVLNPAPPRAPISKPTPGNGAPAVVPPAPPTIEWAAFVKNLDALRDPTLIAKADDPGTGGGPLLPQDPRPEQPTLTPRFNLAWQYEGYVQDGDRVIALVRIAGDQRFLFLGEEVADPSIPGGGKVVVKSIDAETLVVALGDQEQEFKRVAAPNTDARTVLAPVRRGGSD